MKRPKRNVRHFGPPSAQPQGRFEIVPVDHPPEIEIPAHLTQSRRSQHIEAAATDQYVAVLADKLIAWVGQATTTELHAISTNSGHQMALFAQRLEARARQQLGDDDPYFLMLQDFTRQTLNDYFNHLLTLSDESIEVLRRVIADNPYFHALPEKRRGLLRRFLDQFAL